jgi:hypothetical protein
MEGRLPYVIDDNRFRRIKGHQPISSAPKFKTGVAFLISPPVLYTFRLGFMLANLAALKAAIDEGSASGFARGNVFGRVRNALRLPRSSWKS